jgi:hypothetical protein
MASMLRMASRILMIAVLLATAAACTQKGRDNGPRATEETSVRVENQSWLDITVYVVDNGSRTRLGLVNGSNSATFVIPSRVVGLGRSLTFLADPVGSSSVAQSFQIQVNPGDRVRLTLPGTIGR